MSTSSLKLEKMALTLGLVSLPMIFVPHAYSESTSQQSIPAVQKSAPSLWDQQYMFGDWGGTRSQLAERGVTFDFNNIGDFQADVSGSQTHHAAYFGRFRLSADMDFNKLADFDGEFFISAVWQYGQNLSGRYLHVNTLTSSIAGVESVPA